MSKTITANRRGERTSTGFDESAARFRHPTAHTRRAPRRPPPTLQFYGLAVIIAILVALGLIMVLSASSVLSLHTDGSPWTYFVKQFVWTILGVGALLITYKVSYQIWRRLMPLALAGSFALMVLVLLPGIGETVNGARAWIHFGYFAVQPSEMLKFALLLYCADLCARRADRMADLHATLYPMLAVLAMAGVLLMLQPDLGGALVMASIVLGVAFIGGTPLVPLGATAGAAGLAGLVFVMKADYRRERWLAFLNLAQHKQDSGFQVWQSLIGIASGGVTGVGLGASKSKWGFLPEAHTDFIFAIIAEELGFIGVLAVCGLFGAFGLLGVQVALRAKDRFAMLVAGGITAWVLAQAVINIGGVVGLMPLTGLTLPFVSFGGSSLLVMMAAGGMLLNIARTSA
jgi:cell division protein FtsW